jgi:predicted nucleotidyltransferase
MPEQTASTTNATEPTVIFETVHGSQAYGLARPGSDIDRKGIVIGPPAWYLGWIGGPEQIELTPDHVRYDLRKFIRLAAQANPTVFELLWTRPEDHLVLQPAGERLLATRERFLSKRVAERFGRYAHSQLKRIRTHRAWLLDPPAGPPSRAAFGLGERPTISADQLGAAEALRTADETASLIAVDAVGPNFIELLNREKAYKAAQLHWKQYRSWLANRNEVRAALEAQFGYDTKHAMHLVRLQRMAEEILRTGIVQVHRPDRDELLAIRDGAWTYDELERRTEGLAADIERAAAVSTLPDEPDDRSLDALCVSLIQEHLR